MSMCNGESKGVKKQHAQRPYLVWLALVQPPAELPSGLLVCPAVLAPWLGLCDWPPLDLQPAAPALAPAFA